MSFKQWAAAGLTVMLLPTASAQAQSSCPTAPDAKLLPSPAELKDMNRIIASGPRPTGSPLHHRYIAWVRQHITAIPGWQLKQTPYPIDRWLQKRTRLRVRYDGKVRNLDVAAAVPYSQRTTKKGVAAPLLVVPAEAQIGPGARGKVVVREAPPGSIQNALFLLPIVSWSIYDPGGTIDPTGNFYGDFLNYNARLTDMRAAGANGAAAVLFLKNLPTAQLKGHYEPYDGERFAAPGQFLGADEAAVVREAAAAQGSARVVVEAQEKHVTTPSLTATLPGAGAERIVIDSHTDGTNAAEDNGPVAMVAMARYFASLPVRCRPRTIELEFSTAHFFQRLVDKDRRHGGSGQAADRLDADYDKGTVAGVLVLEHLGAIEYAEADRGHGLPGKMLRPTGRRSIQFVAITPSLPLVQTVQQVVAKYDMRRSLLLQGADAPGTTVPMHCNFGGEGTPYNDALLPTVGVIAAPMSLYDPEFNLEGIDFGVMHAEMLGWTELVNRMQAMSSPDIAGLIPLERLRRAAGGTPCGQGA